eukprot:6445925-Pyramimonas_sp.AAC.1
MEKQSEWHNLGGALHVAQPTWCNRDSYLLQPLVHTLRRAIDVVQSMRYHLRGTLYVVQRTWSNRCGATDV